MTDPFFLLNCSVFCETCISPVNEMLTCQVCQSLHPRGSPKVCVYFDHFLQEHFPTEYAMRMEAVQAKQVHVKSQHPITCTSHCLIPSFPNHANCSIYSSDNMPLSSVHICIRCLIVRLVRLLKFM